MTKIIYLTNAMHFNDFEKLMKYVDVMPNPSNQNFHYRFITSLSEHYKVKVISQRPINHRTSNLNAVLDEYHHNFFYPGFHLRPISRNFELFRNSIQMMRSLKITREDYVFVDLLNLNLVQLARYAKRRFKTRIIGILTDNPNNLSNVKKRYIENVEKSFSICDGFVFLTEDLNTYANTNNLPYTIINGVISYTKIKPEIDEKFGKYIYFAGALYERYGVKNLIEAFLSSKSDLHLVIAGHGPLSSEITFLAESHPRIDFLGSVSPYRSLMYANAAYININPRVFDENLDKYSIPSKVIEFANTGKPVISCHHTLLKSVYKDSIYWTDDSIPALKQAIETVSNHYESYLQKATLAKEIGEQNYGKKEFSRKIDQLIKSLSL